VVALRKKERKETLRTIEKPLDFMFRKCKNNRYVPMKTWIDRYLRRQNQLRSRAVRKRKISERNFDLSSASKTVNSGKSKFQ